MHNIYILGYIIGQNNYIHTSFNTNLWLAWELHPERYLELSPVVSPVEKNLQGKKTKKNQAQEDRHHHKLHSHTGHPINFRYWRPREEQIHSTLWRHHKGTGDSHNHKGLTAITFLTHRLQTNIS